MMDNSRQSKLVNDTSESRDHFEATACYTVNKNKPLALLRLINSS